MSPAARGWLDAVVGVAVIAALTSACEAQAAQPISIPQEKIMTTKHSEGPFTAHREGPTGYTIVRNRDGQMIGAAVSTGESAKRPPEEVAANGRLFAAAHTLCSAVTIYASAVEAAFMEGFTPEIVNRIEQANADAHAAFVIMEGATS